MCVGGKLYREVAHVHGAAIPFQLETEVLLTDAIVRQSMRPQIVPLLTEPVVSLAYGPCLPPAQAMSCFLALSLCYPGKEARASDGVMDLL